MIFQVNALELYVIYLLPCFWECQRARSIAVAAGWKIKASDKALVIKLGAAWRERYYGDVAYGKLLVILRCR